jgi:hypothetical protein
VLEGTLQRLRPLITLVLALVVILPGLWGVVLGRVAPLTLLAHLAESLCVAAVLVWLVSGVVLHYARVQAGDRVPVAPDRDHDR